MSKDDQNGKVQLNPARKVLFLLVSLTALVASLYLTDLEARTAAYSVILAIVLFAFLLRLHGRAPCRFLIPSPKTTLDTVVFWPVALFFLFAARYIDWTFVGLALALVGVSVLLAIRPPGNLFL